jgi:hypothetical protein
MANKNEELLKKYQASIGQARSFYPERIEKQKVVEKSKSTKKRGRPKRLKRPKRAAAKRTHEGEERYIVTLKTVDIDFMKDMAKLKKETIKTVFSEAIEIYRLHQTFHS